jgi:TetR/AcrR family transcriptional regulator, cholesterol catabolism regulator
MIDTDKHRHFREEALKLILQKGFKGTTMRELAQSLDCDVANIYNYIPSKQIFLKDLLFEMSDHFHAGIDEIMAAGLSPVDQIRQLVRLYVELTFALPLQVALLANEWRHLEEPELTRFVTERSRFEGKVLKIVGKGIRSGALKKMSPETATYLLLSSLRWLFHFIREVPATNRLRLEEEIIDFVLNGLRREGKV